MVPNPPDERRTPTITARLQPEEKDAMRVLGLNVAKGQLRYAVVEGTLSEPMLLSHGKLQPSGDVGSSIAGLMAWYRARFSVLLEEHGPEKVGYRMHMGRAMTQEQVAIFHYPWGLLLAACYERGIGAVELTGSSLTEKRFGLERGRKPMDVVDERLKGAPSQWDDQARYAACAGWGALSGA